MWQRLSSITRISIHSSRKIVAVTKSSVTEIDPKNSVLDIYVKNSVTETDIKKFVTESNLRVTGLQP